MKSEKAKALQDAEKVLAEIMNDMDLQAIESISVHDRGHQLTITKEVIAMVAHYLQLLSTRV